MQREDREFDLLLMKERNFRVLGAGGRTIRSGAHKTAEIAIDVKRTSWTRNEGIMMESRPAWTHLFLNREGCSPHRARDSAAYDITGQILSLSLSLPVINSREVRLFHQRHALPLRTQQHIY